MQCRLFSNLIFSVCVAGSVSLPAFAAVYQIQPDEAASEDTFVYSGSGLTGINFDGTNPTPLGPPGSPTVGATYGIYLGASTTAGGNHDTKSLVKFDLSSLAGISGAQVASARLRLFSLAIPTSKFPGSESPSNLFSVSISVHEPAVSWGETTANWNNQPAPGVATITSSSINGIDQYFEFTVTSSVQSWLNGGTNLGLLLSQDAAVTNGNNGNSVGALFNSSFAAGNRPILEITTVPEPSSLLLAGIALVACHWVIRRGRRA